MNSIIRPAMRLCRIRWFSTSIRTSQTAHDSGCQCPLNDRTPESTPRSPAFLLLGRESVPPDSGDVRLKAIEHGHPSADAPGRPRPIASSEHLDLYPPSIPYGTHPAGCSVG